MSEDKKISRRAVAKGAAWSVPAVAIAAAAPAYALSKEVPTEPVFSWATGCATTGNGRGCSGQEKALQIPLTLKNDTGKDLVFVVTDARAANGNGGNLNTFNWPGAAGIYTNKGSQVDCSPLVGDCATCASVNTANPKAHVCVGAGKTLSLWMAFNTTNDNASSFIGRIKYQWYDAATCDPVGSEGQSSQTTAISPNNCG